VPFEPFGDAPRFGGRESLIKRRLDMGVEVILHEGDFFGFREVGVGQVFQNMRVIDGGAPLGDLDMPPAFKRREQHEQIGRAVAPVFVINARRPAWPHGQRHTRFGQKLFAGFVETNQRVGWIVRARIDRQHILHRRHKRSIGVGRNHPLLFQMRLERIFFNVRPTVLK